MICSGDLTRVGSGGDFTRGSSGTSGTGGWGLQLEMEMAVSRPSSPSSVGGENIQEHLSMAIHVGFGDMRYEINLIIGAFYV